MVIFLPQHKENIYISRFVSEAYHQQDGDMASVNTSAIQLMKKMISDFATFVDVLCNTFDF